MESCRSCIDIFVPQAEPSHRKQAVWQKENYLSIPPIVTATDKLSCYFDYTQHSHLKKKITELNIISALQCHARKMSCRSIYRKALIYH